jgi:hypothetical protein
VSRTSIRLYQKRCGNDGAYNGHLLTVRSTFDATICMAGQSFGRASWFCLPPINDWTQTDTRDLPTTAFETLAWFAKVHVVFGDTKLVGAVNRGQ